MAGKHYYGYQGYSGQRRGSAPTDGLFGWTVFIFLLIGLVFLCWMGSYYIFAHPEKAANHRLLMRLHKLEEPQRFEITAAPRGEFLKPGQLLQRFGSMSAAEIRRTNETLLRSFVRNYHQNRDLVPYSVGTYRIIGTLPLSPKTFCPTGLVAILQAVEQPEVILEQLFTTDERNLPALERALAPGQQIKLEKPLDLSAVIHIDRLPDNRIRLTTMPLLYGSYGSGQGPASFSLEPPSELNLDSGLPVLTNEQIDQLQEGRIAGSKDDKRASHLKRIAEEAPSPTPEPRVAKAIAVAPTRSSALPGQLSDSTEPTVARAIPVNAPAVMPAIPVNTPAPAALPSPPSTAIPPPAKVAATPSPATSPEATMALQTNSAPGEPSVVQPAAAPSEVWPVYTPGQMPRGRLVDASEGHDLAERGVGGERSYLKGRFTVTASGNGRAVLRPQGAIAGVPMGPNSRIRVIVEFPAGTIPPNEGNIISRDNLRPFMITSVKRGDDGQINIYAREVTRGQ